MLTDKKTLAFEKWFNKLPANIRPIVTIYITRVKQSNFSNCKSVGDGVSEIKINFQKGYRVYYTILNNEQILLLLAGGDKSSQQKDIVKAKEIKDYLESKEAI
jgi:putative addiction module killer protein